MWDTFVDRACRALCRYFPSRCRVIPRADEPGTPLLTQFVVWPEKLYLQHFHSPESRDYFHWHRWEYMRSFVLSGQYREEHPVAAHFSWFIVRSRFQSHRMTNLWLHRVDSWSPKCWTLFYMGKVVDPEWGYVPRGLGPSIPWHRFVNEKIPHIETGKVTDR